jgi:CubicO group peptidase (beta-lactamase class C family)
MAVGKAVCQGKLSLDTLAADLVPELAGKDLGAASVRDLLRMSSGTWEGNPDSTIYSPEQWAAVLAGKVSYVDILATPRVSTAHTGLFGKRKPGEAFAYRGTDPLLLGVMINRATDTTYAIWVEREVLLPAGIETPAVIGQDHFGYGHAEGNVRLTLDDWVRFAVWVKDNEQAHGCFGDFVRAATRTQIPNRWKEFGKLFDGYGYLTWTENLRQPDSYWAVGHGGQRIGWNHRNRRMIVAFSNLESYMDELYLLYRSWSALP